MRTRQSSKLPFGSKFQQKISKPNGTSQVPTQAIQFAIMNALRTGHVVIDTLICMVVPSLLLLFQTCFGALFTRGEHDEVFKFRYMRMVDVYDDDTETCLLQKAIIHHLRQNIPMDAKSGFYDLVANERDASYEVKSIDMKKLQVHSLPLLNAWIKVKDQVYFHWNTSARRQVFYLASNAEDGIKHIDLFVREAFTQYQLHLDGNIGNPTRYLFLLSSNESKSSGQKKRRIQRSIPFGGIQKKKSQNTSFSFKRYALAEDKTFDNLFFEQKRSLLTLLDNFTHKRGKFSVPGMPHKLGLLLHGPPGTGKTSLIKAIAQHTNRHLVSLSLEKIKTNQELLDLMGDMNFRMEGESAPTKLTFRNTLFVLEDMDCASSIVVRGQDESADKDVQRWKNILEDTLSSEPKDKKDHGDKLDLDGLLQALDGIGDSPGRMVIMTTNHPEKIDPAILGFGRLSKQVKLDFMIAHQARLMIQHYCSSVFDVKQVERLEVLCSSISCLTPAQLEQICIESESVNEVLDTLQSTHNLVVG